MRKRESFTSNEKERELHFYKEAHFYEEGEEAWSMAMELGYGA